jgi:drug/metabolite transporter (DMT)-like permease
VAFTAYAWLLRVAPVSKVATYAYVNPVVAVALGAALADEVITGTMVVAGVIIVLAVAIVVREESRDRPLPAR